MSDAPDATGLLERVTARYRRAVVAKAAVFAALALSVVGVLAWRLLVWQRPGWIVAGGVGFALIVAAGFAWRLRRAWMSAREAAAQLDRALGLQQRLTTVSEFAHAPRAPALYPLLIEETTQRLSTRQVRFPRPLDRTAGALAIVLFLLLWWPGRGRVPLLQLAQRPSTIPPTPPPKAEPSPPPEEQERQRQQQDRSGAQQTGQRGPSQSSGDPSSSQAPQPSSTQTGQQETEHRQPREGTQQAQSAQERGKSGDRSRQDSRQQTGDRRQETSDSNEERAASQGHQAGTTRSDAEEASAARASQDQAGRGGGQGFGNQDAIHAEIQQLLKEVSGELKQLEAQLAAAKEQPHPDAGSSTDPDLYEAPMAPEQPQGVALPIQLTTDTAETEQQRPGGGVGRPSDKATASTPQAQAEEAQLSEEPLEETSAARQPIPSEYREVFDRLHRQRQQPSEETK